MSLTRYIDESNRDEVVYSLDGLENAATVRSAHVITSVRVRRVGGHELVTVWNRGGNAGTLTVNIGDGFEIARRLLMERTP